MLVLTVAGCDNPTSISDKPEKPSSSKINPFFDVHPDSIGPLLELAIDTLQSRQDTTPFVETFIEERGQPVWEAYSSFYQQGRPVLLVPVQATNQSKVSGLVAIALEANQPVYRWIPRGADLKGKKTPQKKELEMLMLGFEKLIFGKVVTSGVKVRAERIKNIDEGTKRGKMLMYIGTVCAYVGSAPKGCTDYYVWVEGGGGGSGSGSSSGFGGSSGGSSGGPGDGPDSDPGPPNCDGSYKMIPEDQQSPYAGPSLSPCEKQERRQNRVWKLQDILAENDFALLKGPCDEFSKYVSLAEFTPTDPAVVNKLRDLKGYDYSSAILGAFDIQKIQEAAGDVINMDEFSVQVTALPNGMNANEFLYQIRTNINKFINTDYSEFAPYNQYSKDSDYPFEDAQKWNSHDPIGAILHIGIPNDSAVLGDDGSVM